MAGVFCSTCVSSFLLVLLLLPLFANANTQMPCPPFSCALGSYLNAKFIDRSAPWDEATDYDSGVLQTYYFDARDFGAMFPDITNGTLKNAQKACALACSNYYNFQTQWNDNPPASYWMFEQTCTDGPGGQCSCMAADVCAGNYFSDEYIEGYEYGGQFSVPASYTVGQLCGGGISGDPHFTGADGSHFDFSGTPNQTFAVVSDAHVQVNAYLGGRYSEWGNRIKALTWIRQVSIMWGHHVAVLSARSGPDAAYNNGYLQSVVVDGETLDVAPHSTVSAADGEFSVTWNGVQVKSGDDLVDELRVSVGESLVMRLILRPEVWDLRTTEDALIHFTLLVDSAQLSNSAHGILGQTFRPDFAGRLAQQKLEYSTLLGTFVVPGDNAEGFIDGGVDDYRVDSLLRANCRFCRFARGTEVDQETARALALSTARDSSVARKLLDYP